ncbi:MAG TPA: hypothetical protein VG225_02270 [Terracidiphilus sp.]|jgi:hypothetical protein|nr:hypothetical protein [Terracidiphilus sp.]
MKRLLGYAILLAAFSVPAFAAKNSQSVTLSTPVTVGATQLPAGDYKVSWTGTGSSVQVTLEQKGTQHPATVTVAAKLVEAKNAHVQLTTSTQAGVNTLQTIDLNHVSLVFGSAPSSGQ